MLSGKTTLIAHIGYPTEAFKAPLVYNPWFEQRGIDAMVVPMGVMAEDYPVVMRSLFKLTNVRGALVTMPHKVTTVELLDEVTTTVKVAGSCNAILKRPDGTLLGDMFDGTGFTRGLKHKGFVCEGARCLVVGAGGVGSAIRHRWRPSAWVRSRSTMPTTASVESLAARLSRHYPRLVVRVGPRTLPIATW